MRLRQKDLRRTIERNAQRRKDRDVDGVSTREGYDRWAPVYDQRENPLIALEDRELPELVGDVGGLEVLDLGCGTGRWTKRLVERGANVTALDFSAGMLAEARKRVPTDQVSFVEHDLARPLPFSDGSFDVVLSALVLEHLPELERFFHEIARVCRSTGRVVLSGMHPAMMLLDSQAEFADPTSGRDVRPRSHDHQISEFVMAGIRSGLRLTHISEHEVDGELQAQSPRSARFAGWPFLLLLVFGIE